MVDSEEWLKNTIDGGCIRSYDYSEFSVNKPIGKGGFGIVYKAKWKKYGLAIALKQLNIISMDEKTIQRFAKELKNLQKVCEHPNIIKFYGVTRDFGLSKDETSKTSNASVHGMQAYIDPQCLKSESYKRSKKSDIYSFGVILWEISSGRPPFQSLAKIPYGIVIHVSQGGREIPIEGTPSSYIQLYEKCWNYDPNQRPELEEISRKLMDLSENENFGASKFDEFISDTTSKISTSDIPLLTNSNNDFKKILEPLKFIDDLFMERFLNAGIGMWELQTRSYDVGVRFLYNFIT
ncbi:kinase-like domain-containing protein [Gigaspora rosea]|uniref:Kinase-like domain-containing protein n=1 Tax=Gigaspora rosea TaxID=44941 RepID=A0A397V1Q0_9GLOM|nr:kinase-like domain-containing protein [Gigaspora rosea]